MESYCCVIITYAIGNGQYRQTQDVCVFPNPDKDPKAKQKCADRAKLLDTMLKTSSGPLGEAAQIMRDTLGIGTRLVATVKPFHIQEIK
jgi:hypothetical protein